jgi:DNA-binding MarR family transcriptional regulator
LVYYIQVNEIDATQPPRDLVDLAVAQWQCERPDLDFTAMSPLARLARLGLVGGRHVDHVFAEAGLDRGEFNVLAALRRKGPPFSLTPSRLADAELTSRGGMTKRIDRLERRGLVERLTNKADRRSLLIALTPEGLRLTDEVITKHTANESRLLAALSPNELAAFDDVLRKLLIVIGDGGQRVD